MKGSTAQTLQAPTWDSRIRYLPTSGHAAVRYIGTAERLPVGFLYDKIADPRVFGTRCDVVTLAALIAERARAAMM
jgi:hypothetical protein